MVLLVGLQDFVQVIEGLGSIEALLLKVILTQDETAVIEALVRQGRHIVALTVLQVQLIDIVLQTHFLYAGVEVGCPITVIADGNKSAVQGQRCILTCCGLVENDIGYILAGVQGERNLCGVIGNGNCLNVKVDIAALLHFGEGQPILFIREGGVIRQVDADVEGILAGIIRRAGLGRSGSGAGGCAFSGGTGTAAAAGCQCANCHASCQGHCHGTAD